MSRIFLAFVPLYQCMVRGYCVPCRGDILQGAHCLLGQGNCLLMVLSMRVVHHRTTHRNHLRYGSQFYQPFPLELVLDAFCDAFVKPQGMN